MMQVAVRQAPHGTKAPRYLAVGHDRVRRSISTSTIQCDGILQSAMHKTGVQSHGRRSWSIYVMYAVGLPCGLSSLQCRKDSRDGSLQEQ